MNNFVYEITIERPGYADLVISVIGDSIDDAETKALEYLNKKDIVGELIKVERKEMVVV